MGPPLSVKVGEIYGSWTVIEALPKKSLCQCGCGVVKYVFNGNLRDAKKRGMCRSCSNRDMWEQKRGICSHLSYEFFHRLRTIVNNAIMRCTDETYPQWKDYGGRGITVCSEWLEDKLKFILHLSTLEDCEDESLVIDRKDNSRGYEPGNVRFISHSLSNYNRRSFTIPKGIDGRFTHKL